MLTHRGTVKRLLRKHSALLPSDHRRGKLWYPREFAWIRSQIDELAPGVPYRHGATIYAALSPQTPWERNRMLVQRVLRGEHDFPGGVFQRSWERAVRAIDEGPLVLNGPKVLAFDCNLAGCLQCLTLDTHMHQIAGADYAKTKYADLDAAYREAARRAGVAPAHFQATLWLAYRPARDSDPDERRT